MDKKTIITVIVAVALSLLLGVFLKQPAKLFVGGESNCSNGYTCFTYLDVLNNLVVDGITSFTGAITATGNVTVSGTTSLATTTTSGIFTQAGCTYATSTSAETNNLTFTATEIQQCSNWIVTPGRIMQTLTLPASSTVTSLIPSVGNRVTIQILNGSSTADSTFRLAVGAGWDIMEASTTPASVASTTPGARGTLTLIRKANTDIDATFSFFK